MKEQLNGLFAAGGGDGPEAMTAALKAASDLDWRPDAAKMAILITDAPPHGIGEYGDGFPNGSPDGEDPLVLARSMSARGISLFVVACEPALSGYQHAVDFYHGLVTITSGMLVPLTTASLLSHVVVAAAGEVMDLERLHRELGDSVLERMRSLSLDMQSAGDAPVADATSLLVDQVSVELHERLLLRNESTKQLIVENIYRESEGMFVAAHGRIRAQYPRVDARPECDGGAAAHPQSHRIAPEPKVPGDAARWVVERPAHSRAGPRASPCRLSAVSACCLALRRVPGRPWNLVPWHAACHNRLCELKYTTVPHSRRRGRHGRRWR